MLYFIIVSLVLILDQWVKYWVTLNIASGGAAPMQLIPNVLELTYVRNTGAAFGLLADNPMAKWIFAGLAVLFVIIVVILIVRNTFNSKLASWSLALVAAGAIGNLIDRVFNGYVIDMFSLKFMKFPVFNVADIFVCVFIVLFIIAVLFCGREKEEKQPKKKAKKAKKEAAPQESAPAPEQDGDTAPAGESVEPGSGFRRKPDKHVSLDSVFDFVDRGSASEDPEKMAEDEEEFWSQFKHGGRPARKPAPKPEEKPAPVVDPLRLDPVRASARKPEAPAADPAPAPAPEPAPEPESGGAPAVDDFDLDSILAEFGKH